MINKSQLNDESPAPRQEHYLTRWGDEEPLYEAVTEAVSNFTGDARSAVASQYDRAHAATLSQLFGGVDEAPTASTGVVKFLISECIVSVHSDGRLVVSLPTQERNTID